MGKLVKIHKNIILNEDDIKSIMCLYHKNEPKPYIIEIENSNNMSLSYETLEEAEKVFSEICYLK